MNGVITLEAFEAQGFATKHAELRRRLRELQPGTGVEAVGINKGGAYSLAPRWEGELGFRPKIRTRGGKVYIFRP